MHQGWDMPCKCENCCREEVIWFKQRSKPKIGDTANATCKCGGDIFSVVQSINNDSII